MSINANTLAILSNEANLIADALRTIDRDHTEQIAKLNADHKATRSEMVQELSALNKALKALRAPIVVASGSAPTTGKKLSDEHRQKIKDALQRRSAEKAAAKSTPADTKAEPAPAAEAATEELESGSGKKTVAKKAVARG